MFTYPLRVEMADASLSRPLVVVDQRDYARLEASDVPDDAVITRTRFLAWSAMTRNGWTSATWEAFNFEECVYATDIKRVDENSEGEQGLDPGQPAPSGHSSSPSPRSPGNPSPALVASKAGTRATSTP